MLSGFELYPRWVPLSSGSAAKKTTATRLLIPPARQLHRLRRELLV